MLHLFTPVIDNSIPKKSKRNPLFMVAGLFVLGLALALLIFGGSWFGMEDAGIAPTEFKLPNAGIVVGDPAPDFTLAALDGNPVSLNNFRGQPVIINFWATWCAPCRLEMPDLQTAYESHQADDLVILAVDKDEPLERVLPFFRDELGLTFTALLDQNSVVGDSYQAFNLPTSVFVNGEGNITVIHRGLMTEGQIEDYLAQTIN